MRVFMYCPACDREHDVEVVTTKKTIRICGHNVIYDFSYYRCGNVDTDNEYADGRMVNNNLSIAMNEYLNGNWLD